LEPNLNHSYHTPENMNGMGLSDSPGTIPGADYLKICLPGMSRGHDNGINGIEPSFLWGGGL